MSLIRLNFRDLTLFEVEEAGDTHMAMYATVSDYVGPRAGYQGEHRAGLTGSTHLLEEDRR